MVEVVNVVVMTDILVAIDSYDGVVDIMIVIKECVVIDRRCC